MKRFHSFILAIVLAISWQPSESQTLEANGFKVSIKEYAEGETAVVCGPKKPAYGAIILVKSKDKLKGTYYISMLFMTETQNIFTVKDKDQSLVNPMLVYNKETSTFQYTKNDVLIDEVAIDMKKPMDEQLLDGMILWLKVKRALNDGKK
jgi:hypothetical protein